MLALKPTLDFLPVFLFLSATLAYLSCETSLFIYFLHYLLYDEWRIIAIMQLDLELETLALDHNGQELCIFSRKEEGFVRNTEHIARERDRAYYTTASKELYIGAGHGEQRRNDNNGGNVVPVFGFPTAVCLSALLIVSLVYRGIPLPRTKPKLTAAVRHHRRFAIHNADYRLPRSLLRPRDLHPASLLAFACILKA